LLRVAWAEAGLAVAHFSGALGVVERLDALELPGEHTSVRGRIAVYAAIVLVTLAVTTLLGVGTAHAASAIADHCR
jgi:hypothetical protein